MEFLKKHGVVILLVVAAVGVLWYVYQSSQANSQNSAANNAANQASADAQAALEAQAQQSALSGLVGGVSGSTGSNTAAPATEAVSTASPPATSTTVPAQVPTPVLLNSTGGIVDTTNQGTVTSLPNTSLPTPTNEFGGTVISSLLGSPAKSGTGERAGINPVTGTYGLNPVTPIAGTGTVNPRNSLTQATGSL